MILHVTEHGTHIVKDTEKQCCADGCCWSQDFEIVESIDNLTCEPNTVLFIDSEDTEFAMCKTDAVQETFSCGCPVWFNALDKDIDILPLG